MGVTSNSHKAINNLLEAVDIGHADGQRATARHGASEQRLHVVVEIATVIQARQRVNDSHFDGLLQAGAQTVMVALAAHLRERAGQKLIGVQRTHNVIIHAEIQRAHDHLVSALLRDEQHRNKPGTL